MRTIQWMVLALAWGTVQLPMAWCDDAGLHPEIPASHGSHGHDHDEGDTVHERVDLDFLLLQDGFAAPVPAFVCYVSLSSPDGMPDGVPPVAERPADPPGRRTTVRLL